MAEADLTAVRLRARYTYHPETGLFTHKITNSRCRVGGIAGGLKRGYVAISLYGVYFSAHRLAWLYMTGEWPKGMIDHINGDRADNRFENLRDVSRSVNNQNQKRAHRTSVTGLLGVKPKGNFFESYINLDKKRLYLGRYRTAQEAHAAYLKKKREIHEGCTI